MNKKNRYPIADAVRAAYSRGEEDEAMEPIVLERKTGEALGRIKENKAEQMRSLVKAA